MLSVVVASLTAHVLARRFGRPVARGHLAAIDGLRGYLALFVFLHHSAVWYFYVRTGRWAVPPSNLYTHFGQGSVAVFFMITGFLFFTKLLDGRERGIDWRRLLISRVLRLTPAYVLSMLLLFGVVAYRSGGTVNSSLALLAGGMLQWLGFTILGAPDLNGVAGTSIIVAGVTWSLIYEWFFYFSLPLLAIMAGVTVPRMYLAIGSLVVAFFCARFNLDVPILLPFLGGMITSLLVRSRRFCGFAASTLASVLAVALLIVCVVNYRSSYEYASIAMLSLVFALIAGGNSLFGLLVTPAARTLGDMSYGIYLLHGIFLYLLLGGVFGGGQAAEFSPVTHWLAIVGISPLLVLCCFLVFHFIESPAMARTDGLSSRFRSIRSKGSPS
ncbi:acyltransferase [Azoarcus sp. L1K30]|uniref:acyltransferase family protein n=1 Tax=Azoarcus sp. L1K30 TaxID=2820277 RepID=UPI001B843816|nr:acyltransferase [Azoarcus sp. L1K30]MBR0568241.1 acyltransferase [Azoarcus sp. L1K30]